MQAAAQWLEKAAADATAKVARLEGELALLPRTLEDFDAAQAELDAVRRGKVDAVRRLVIRFLILSTYSDTNSCTCL